MDEPTECECALCKADHAEMCPNRATKEARVGAKVDEYKVETCDDCPLGIHVDDFRGIGPTCRHLKAPAKDGLDKTWGGPPPDWCPLRRMAMRIALEE